MNSQKAQAWFYDMLSNHKKFMRKQTEPHPIWLVWRRDGKEFSEPIENEDSDTNSPLLKVVVLIQKYVPDIWVVFAEGWCALGGNEQDSKKTREETLKMFNRGDINKLPDKLESLTVIGKTWDKKENINESYWLIRDKDEKLIDFKKSPMDKIEARFIDF